MKIERPKIKATIPHWDYETSDEILIGEEVEMPNDDDYEKCLMSLKAIDEAQTTKLDDFKQCCIAEEITWNEIQDMEFMAERTTTWSEL